MIDGERSVVHLPLYIYLALSKGGFFVKFVYPLIILIVLTITQFNLLCAEATKKRTLTKH
ncbi:MAG: hypothetical protein AYP45_01220 [Candidatus Brocadia carolinensis]|uniref:Uncharacterized protein n=1 Tax=Candidatus Brocadia carolinensis TaxID=1004156 RepID=A0A1V4AXI6_9BACT|nr:MAG: hypothetical protein AYP45_01220 [Candidatus Brocadia caroliniensis]